MLFCRLLIFFQNPFFRKILSGIPSECQTDWIQMRPDILSGLIWVQSVCKGYEQKTPVVTSLFMERCQILCSYVSLKIFSLCCVKIV